MAATDVQNHKFIEQKPTWIGKVGAGGVSSASATTMPVASPIGLTNGNVYIGVLNRFDPTGTRKNPASDRETFVGKLSGNEFINCQRGVEGNAQAWEADTMLEILVTAEGWNRMIEGIELEHNQDGTHKKATAEEIKEGIEDAKVITPKGFKDVYDNLSNMPQGYLVNWKITTVATNGNLTVAIKTLANNDPSSGDAVRIRIGNTERTITTALSVTLNAGTNWMDAGADILAAREIDYFVYMKWNATDGVSLGISRIPYAIVLGDFKKNMGAYADANTDPKRLVLSNETNATMTDPVVVIGRCGAILSNTYNWSLPTTPTIINIPIYRTRPLPWNVIWEGYSTPPSVESYYYQIDNHRQHFSIKCNANGISNTNENKIKIPLTPIESFNGTMNGYAVDNAIVTDPLAVSYHPLWNNIINLGKTVTVFNSWTASGYKSVNIKGDMFI